MPDITTPGISLDVCVHRRGRIIKSEFFDLRRGNSDRGTILTLVDDEGELFQLIGSTDSNSEIRQWDYAVSFPRDMGIVWKKSEDLTVSVIQNDRDQITNFVAKNETFKYRRQWIPAKIATMFEGLLS